MPKLPNSKWVPSTNKAKWAVCLDPEDSNFGGKMLFVGERWLLISPLTLEEVRKASGYAAFEGHTEELALLEKKLTEELASLEKKPTEEKTTPKS